jgi:glutamyl-tRNA synthetase
VLRLKIDMESENHAMRDPVVFRICKATHYLQKNRYVVWPMYDFENAVEEELCSITHILRSIEFGEMRIELQNYIKELFGFKKQTVVQYGRFNVLGAITQGRLIRKLIQEKEYVGWDDPRLVTVKALKRRGIQKETFRELAVEVGLSLTPTNLDWSIISAINRKILDPRCNRYFFVENPKEIKIEGAREGTANLKLHPDFPERGARKLRTKNRFLITKKDFDEIKDKKLVRLMDCLNFRKIKKTFIFDSREYEEYCKKLGRKIIHWLPADKKQLVNVEVMMPDATIKKGFGEAALKKLKPGDVIQFARFGFCRLDKKEKNKLKFWFAHD